MIEIKPNNNLAFKDPITSEGLTFTSDIHFGGMFTFAELESAQGKRYLKYMPISFGMRYGSFIDLETEELIFDSLEWYPKLFKKHHDSQIEVTDIAFETLRSEKKSDDLIILNCLDNCYGHALFNILNIPYYQQKEGDLLVIVPSFLSWMVPDGIERVIEVKAKLRDMFLYIQGFNEQIYSIMDEYDTVYMARAYPRPNPKYVDISKHIPDVTPFSLDTLLTSEPDALNITVTLREDKMWINNDLVLKFLNKLSKKRIVGIYHILLIKTGVVHLVLKALKKIQHHKINKFYTELKKITKVNMVVLGLGEKGGLHTDITDGRVIKMDKETELRWAKLYTESHVCIGMLGSNLTLPSLLSGTVISLSAEEKFGKFSADLIIKEENVAKALYKYRMIPSYLSPKKLARYVTRLIRGYSKYHRNFIEQIPQNTQTTDRDAA